MRVANVTRETRETCISGQLCLDGVGLVQVDSGIGFFDHMLDSWARFGCFDLELLAKGDLRVDAHHTVEDCGIVLGQLLKEALGDKAGIERVGDALFPMDEVLAQVAVDISGRGFLGWRVDGIGSPVADFPFELAEEFFRALAMNAGITLHVRLLSGGNSHHVLEAIYKGVGRALRLAVGVSGVYEGVPSTKGCLS
ncbi:MAG: imidazoleglycerol-phosphate dehydratase HisB [Peptococcaceae bacterium]|nr:imidazoleglycerol-phosphate dehydratase HisB [Peptococcaceae bacterium]